MGYSDFIKWALSGPLNEFYSAQRWPTWKADCRQLAGDRGFSIVPFLWAEGPPLAERSRRAVPIEELWRIAMEITSQLQQPREGPPRL